jgi:hypothetical protein
MTLSNGGDGSFSFDPNTAGFCFDPSTGCSPDAIDGNLSGFNKAFSTGEGYDEAFAAAEQAALDQISEFEKKGFDVDLEAGTITDKNGKVTSLDDGGAPKFSASLSKAVSSKMSGIKEALGSGSDASSRSLASAGAGGGVSPKAVSLGALGSFGSEQGVKAKKKDGRGKFLAGLSDKDAGLNGVGFAGDDIFNMIQRRYTKKLQSKEFIGK